MLDVASKSLEEWGNSLVASKVVPDNFNKNSISKTEISDLAFLISILSLEHLVFRVLAIDQSGWSMTCNYTLKLHVCGRLYILWWYLL